MTFYAILITLLFGLLTGAVLTHYFEAKARERKYTEMFASPGKRKRDEDPMETFTPEEKTRIDEIKDELGATILDYQNHG